MEAYKSKKIILLALDVLAIIISFVIAIVIRYFVLIDELGSRLAIFLYLKYFVFALLIYIIFSLVSGKVQLEKQSYREIIFLTLKQQIVFNAIYIVFFYIFKQEFNISRVVIFCFFVGNICVCGLFRILYHRYIKKSLDKNIKEVSENTEATKKLAASNDGKIKHVYIIGSKSIGLYGGFESFVMNLLKEHKDLKNVKYHVSCKANGQGYMELDKLPGAVRINDKEFSYCNAHGFLIEVNEKLGSAQAIQYDLKALKWVCEHIEKNHIENPVVYILASRIGPFEKKYIKRIHSANGLVYQNPDGHEDWRRKWSFFVRKYWKISERYAVKNADLVICDSKNIEKYIKNEYAEYSPKTTYIAYGSRMELSPLKDDSLKYTNWLAEHNLKDKEFYISVGRFVPENNFEVMIREFMLSNSTKDYAIITTDNGKYARELQQKLHYKNDKRIKFVGTVYDTELMSKIRENAYGYFHGHEVGGTNPSLLESLGKTKLNLLYDVSFNKEVAEDTAVYWNKEEGNLAALIDKYDKENPEILAAMGEKAKKRIEEEYSWQYIAKRYEETYYDNK